MHTATQQNILYNTSNLYVCFIITCSGENIWYLLLYTNDLLRCYAKMVSIPLIYLLTFVFLNIVRFTLQN